MIVISLQTFVLALLFTAVHIGVTAACQCLRHLHHHPRAVQDVSAVNIVIIISVVGRERWLTLDSYFYCIIEKIKSYTQKNIIIIVHI